MFNVPRGHLGIYGGWTCSVTALTREENCFLFLFSVPLYPFFAKQFLIDRYFGCCQCYSIASRAIKHQKREQTLREHVLLPVSAPGLSALESVSHSTLTKPPEVCTFITTSTTKRELKPREVKHLAPGYKPREQVELGFEPMLSGSRDTVLEYYPLLVLRWEESYGSLRNSGCISIKYAHPLDEDRHPQPPPPCSLPAPGARPGTWYLLEKYLRTEYIHECILKIKNNALIWCYPT